MERLNLGAGNYPLDGWHNIDLPECDLRRHPWPWDDKSIDEINASHVLEHFTRAEAFLFLLQCYRILKPGGWLHVAVPDMDKFIDAHLTGNFVPLGGYHWTDLNHFMGGDESETNVAQRHRYMWCHASLAWTLDLVGFVNIGRRTIIQGYDTITHAHITLYMEAQKPHDD